MAAAAFELQADQLHAHIHKALAAGAHLVCRRSSGSRWWISRDGEGHSAVGQGGGGSSGGDICGGLHPSMAGGKHRLRWQQGGGEAGQQPVGNWEVLAAAHPTCSAQHKQLPHNATHPRVSAHRSVAERGSAAAVSLALLPPEAAATEGELEEEAETSAHASSKQRQA